MTTETGVTLERKVGADVLTPTTLDTINCSLIAWKTLLSSLIIAFDRKSLGKYSGKRRFTHRSPSSGNRRADSVETTDVSGRSTFNVRLKRTFIQMKDVAKNVIKQEDSNLRIN